MSAYTMTTKQAAVIIGVTPVTIQQAIIYGHLPAEKRKAPTPYGERLTYFLNPDDLPRYAEYRKRRNPKTLWTSDMDSALAELRSSCTVQQIAAYLGVSRAAVKDRIRRLGIEIGHRTMTPFSIPKTGVLLAKTCTGCGELLSAHRFHTNGGRKNGSAQCISCVGKAPWRSGQNSAAKRALNAITADHAHRHRAEWTTSDDQYLTDNNNKKTTYQIALDLGRTMHAVQHRRKAIGLAVPALSLNQGSGKWDIDFPATQREVEEYFEGLNRVVPEELWEWNDEEQRVSA